jgi:cytochrome c oxidase accessory protein FixG
MTSSHRFRRLRRAAFAAQAAVVLGLPFLRVGGESALRFDVPSLSLVAAGARVQIDELFLVLAATLALAFAFILATLVLGRAWCGWACPQGALAEVTRRFAPLQAKRGKDAAISTLALAAVSALVAANLLWYFVSPYDFAARLAGGGLGPVLGGAWAVLGAILFLDLAFLRHRFCATVCPYAKVQGALFDRHTLAVAYDARRDADCVECGKCIRVCPTGIDIRRGLQVECIACAECVDACGPIMARLGKRNLIGYAWGEPGGSRRLLRSAAVALAALTTASTGLAAAAISTRSELDLGAAAVPGSPARHTPDGRTANAYDVSLTNRGHATLDVELALTAGNERATLRPDTVRLAPGEHRRVRVLAAVRLSAGSGPQEAELVAEARGRRELRMTRRVTFVPPHLEPQR